MLDKIKVFCKICVYSTILIEKSKEKNLQKDEKREFPNKFQKNS